MSGSMWYSLVCTQRQRSDAIKKTMLGLFFVALWGCGSSGSGSSNPSADKPVEVSTQNPEEPEKKPDDIVLKANEAYTAQGIVAGMQESGVLSFRGVPYAEPPIGNRRFAPPRVAIPRESVFNATEFGSDCPQKATVFGSKSLEEDCLNLNIYSQDTQGPYPVMVWIFGGGLLTGSGGDSYHPERLVSQGVVVVTLNYRLGALGFLAHPALTAEMGQGSGNYGLMDQQMALQWVQDNIANFGGDPGNVTIMGESAGGHSVLSHLASPTAANLFHKAIVQSGSYSPNQMVLEQAELEGEAYVQNLGCSDDALACLREKPVQELLDQQNSDFYLPATHTTILPSSINEALSRGQIHSIPVLAGTNLHEARLFIAIQDKVTPLIDESIYRVSANVFLRKDQRGLDAAKISNRYLRRELNVNPHKYRFALSAMRTDWEFACNSLDQVEALSKQVPTFMYEFADQNAPSVIPENWTFPLGAAHASEVPYVMNSEQAMYNRGAEQAQIFLSETMIRYWAEFAKNGSPGNGGGNELNWPSVGDSGQVMTLTLPQVGLQTTGGFSDTHSCAYWKNPDLR